MKTVYVIRHAEAEEVHDAAVAGRSDAERQLTDEGRHQLKKGARGLRKLVDRLDLLLSSPLVRAVQTADILAQEFTDAERAEHVRLSPGFDHVKLLKWVGQQPGDLALVGHEPDLSQWIGYVTSGLPRSLATMKKGSVCRLDMPDTALSGEARIAWLLTLKQLTKVN